MGEVQSFRRTDKCTLLIKFCNVCAIGKVNNPELIKWLDTVFEKLFDWEIVNNNNSSIWKRDDKVFHNIITSDDNGSCFYYMLCYWVFIEFACITDDDTTSNNLYFKF